MSSSTDVELGELPIPIVQAPLAGGPSTPRLTAAVSGAGAFGFLAAGYKTPEALAAMQKADAKHGEQVAKVCLQCHTFDKGGPNKIGPNLFGVLDENIASVPGYTFSSALSADKDKKWDPDELNVWLYKPQDFAKGTKMTFAGLPKLQDRADVVAYLQSLK